MRKIATSLFVFTLLLSLFISNVSGDTTITYDSGDSNISFNDGVLYLNNYVHNDGDFSTNVDGVDYSIVSDGDLVINLTGDNYIYGEGIYASGNIKFEGDGTLYIEDLEMDGDSFVVDSGDITIDITNGGAYWISYIKRPGIAYYDKNGANTYLRWDRNNYQYIDFMDGSTIDKFVLSKNDELADINNLYTTSPIEDDQSFEEYKNLNGLAYKEADVSSVNYDSSKLTYTIVYSNNAINDNKEIEMVFNTEELGKGIKYKVLKAKNIVTIDGNSINEGSTILPSDYIGQEDCFVLNGENNVVAGGVTLTFQNTSNDYYLKLEVLGSNGSHRYININYVDVEESNTPTSTPNNEERVFIVPNTGIY